MSVIDDIKQKTDIAEIIGQYTRLSRSGKTLKGLCPFHSEKHGSFFVYPDQQSWHCFGACGTGGDVFSFVMKKEGCDFTEAKKILAERAGIALVPESTGDKERKEKNDRLYHINGVAVDYYHQLLLTSPEGEKTRQYLLKRGLNASSVENFKLSYAPLARESLLRYLSERGFSGDDMLAAGLIVEHETKARHDVFHHRLLFPIADIRDRVTGFGGRALDDSPPKYLNTPQTDIFDKKATLYGLNRAKEAAGKLDQIVIVEGYLDVIIAHQYGFNNVVASMGTAISEIHAQTIRKITKNVVLALDPDSAGEEAMMRSAGLENVLGAEMRVAVLPGGTDPDEFIIADAPAWKKLIAEAAPVMDFIFARVTAPLNLKTARGKAEAVEKLLLLAGQIKDIVRQSYYVNRLAEIAGVTAQKLEFKLRTGSVPARSIKKVAAAAEQAALTARPLEDYCLAMLLKYPELTEKSTGLLPEYLESTENREILSALRKNSETAKIKDGVDGAIWERCEVLMNKDFPSDKLEPKLMEGILRLREDYLKRMAQRAALRAPEDGTSLPDEADIAVNRELQQVFLDRERLGIRKRKKQ